MIFDLDGTLVDSYRPITTALNAARSAFGLGPLSVDEVRRVVGRGLESLMEQQLGVGRAAEGVRIFRETYAGIFAAGTRALPGARTAPRELARRGFAIAVASNKPARFGKPIVELLGLADIVAPVLGPDCGVPAKPAPDMLLLACRELSVAPAEAVYIGDMRLDAQCARAAGTGCLLVSTGGESNAELSTADGVQVVPDLFAAVQAIA